MNHKKPISAMGMIILTTISISLLWRDNLTLTIITIILSGLSLYLWRGRRDIFYFAVPGILGPFFESICIYFGAWTYSNPLFLIPPWLPFVWGIAGLSTWKIVESLLKEGGTGK